MIWSRYMRYPFAINEVLKKLLTASHYRALKNYYRHIVLRAYSLIFRNNLYRLAIAYKTDKESEHHLTLPLHVVQQ